MITRIAVETDHGLVAVPVPTIRITCGHCRETHHSVSAIKACYAGATVFTCDWLVEVLIPHPEDGAYPGVVPCGAEAIFTERGFECEAGHTHVNAEFRAREGWDYAEDRDEAKALVGAGVMPVQMDGHIFV